MKTNKGLKKLAALVLALCMCMGLCATSFAATGSSSTDTGFGITIENSSNGNTYNAYKIFDVTYDGDNYSYTVTSDSPWYTLFTNENNATIGDYSMPFVFTATTGEAEEGATVYIVTVGTDSTTGVAYSDDYIIAYLNAAIATIATYNDGVWTIEEGYEVAGTATGNGGTVTINLNEPGYYFVTSTVGAIVSVTTANPDPTIVDKNPTISIEKEIVHDDGSDDVYEADGVGEDVSFDVKAIVPIIEGEDYVVDYTITDTMTNGLLIELAEGDFYQGTDGKYYLTNDKINEWITLYNGAGDALTSFTDYVYSYSFELIGYDVYTDDTTGNEVHTFSGFILTYYTYNVEQYKEDLAAALVEAGYDLATVWPSDSEWPDASQINDNFDFPSEDYFASYSNENTVGTKYPTNASIEIKYSAHVSSLEGYENTNTIYMDHDVTPFNHPVPWNPTPGPQMFARDYVYSWELQILKIDGEDRTPLEGATFTLESNDMKDVKVGHSYLYVPVSLLTGDTYTYEGETYDVADFESTYYYSEDNGANYTAVSIDLIFDENGDYNSPYNANNLYHRILTDEVTEGEDTQYIIIQGTTDENGMLYFEGLGTGTYILTEIASPDGYNLLDDPIIFQITFEESGDETTGYVGRFTVTYGSIDEDGDFVPNSEDNGGVLDNNYILIQNIENNSGSILPGTGGMGTTIFYVIGIIIVAGAVVLLVTRRRMNRAA